MSREKIQIRYEGPELDGHSIDVAVIGPALTALGELVSDSNAYVNGDDVRVRVRLHADISANCVTLDLGVHWETIYDSIKGLLGSEHVKNAKDLLEWIGLIAGPPVSLLFLIRWLWKKKQRNEVVLVKRNGDKIVLTVKGSAEKLEVQKAMYEAALSQNVQDDLKQAMRPLLKEGIEKTTFIHKSGEISFDREAAKEFAEIPSAEIDPEAEEQEVVGHIVIHAPVFETGSKHWKFKWNGRVESIDVSNTSIPETVLKRGKVVVGDAFKVRMSMVEKQTKRGFRHKFRIKEVLDFRPERREQAEIIWTSEDDEETESNESQES